MAAPDFGTLEHQVIIVAGNDVVFIEWSVETWPAGA